MKTTSMYTSPVQPSTLIPLTNPMPPAEAPNPLLTVDDVAEVPLPLAVKSNNLSTPAPSASKSPNAQHQVTASLLIEALSNVPASELALRLYLQCAEAANDCDLEPVACEFFAQAYILFEEKISDSREQVTALYLIIGTLQRMHVFGVENRDTLTHKATGYSAKMLKKPDRCRAVYACSHLFWADVPEGVRDGRGCKQNCKL